MSEKFLLLFNPDQWSATEKFRRFMGPPYTVEKELSVGTQAAEGHLGKFRVLAGLANRLRIGLTEDLAELERDGYSPVSRSREYAAITETLICELYSCLDGIRRVLYSVHRKVRGMQNNSTEKLFKRAHKNTYGPELPVEVRNLLAAAYQTWFPELHRIRTELIHGDVGSCHLDPETNTITYTHPSLGTSTRALVISDIVSKINGLAESVSELMESIFGFLFAKLDPVDRKLPCGIYRLRVYERNVAPAADLTLGSGTCLSKAWFENEKGLECPMRLRCGAYSPNTPGQEDKNPI